MTISRAAPVGTRATTDAGLCENCRKDHRLLLTKIPPQAPGNPKNLQGPEGLGGTTLLPFATKNPPCGGTSDSKCSLSALRYYDTLCPISTGDFRRTYAWVGFLVRSSPIAIGLKTLLPNCDDNYNTVITCVNAGAVKPTHPSAATQRNKARLTR
jgi:hypothetical protein